MFDAGILMRNPSPMKLRTSTCRSSKPSAGSSLSPHDWTWPVTFYLAVNNMHQKLHQNLCMVTTFWQKISTSCYRYSKPIVCSGHVVVVVGFATFNIPPRFYLFWTSSTWSWLTESCFKHAPFLIMFWKSISMWNFQVIYVINAINHYQRMWRLGVSSWDFIDINSRLKVVLVGSQQVSSRSF